MTDEEWRSIPSWPHHEVSSYGRVRSVDRYVPSGIKNHTHRLVRGQLLKLRAARSGGYLAVPARLGARSTTFYVHSLVLEAFVGPRPEGLVACHGDGDPSNNHVDNLRWDTCSANVADTIRHGRHHYASAEACKRGHELIDVNLDRYQLSHGHRLCRACKNAHQTMRSSPLTGEPRSIALQQAADLAYLKIMGDPA